MHKQSLAAALLCLAVAAGPAAMAAGKKDKVARKPAEPQAVVTDVAPPSGSWEAAPAPNKDYVWSKGYYDWKDGRYQWTPGEWVLKQEGKSYEQHQWVKRPDGKFELTGGKWVDGDQAKGKDADDTKAAGAGKDAKDGHEAKGKDAHAGKDAKDAKASDAGSMGAAPATTRR